MFNLRYISCKKCGEDIELDYNLIQQYTTCANCKQNYIVNYDAEFINGRWVDNTEIFETEMI